MNTTNGTNTNGTGNGTGTNSTTNNTINCSSLEYYDVLINKCVLCSVPLPHCEYCALTYNSSPTNYVPKPTCQKCEYSFELINNNGINVCLDPDQLTNETECVFKGYYWN